MKTGKKIRVPLINGKYLGWTLLILLGELVLLAASFVFHVLDNVLGYIVLPFFGLFTVYTAYEACVLVFEAVSASTDGIVVAGKDAQGRAVHFELDTLMSVFPCDQKGNPLPEDQETYENIGVAFRFKDGKQRVRQTSRLTKKQLEKLRKALGVSYVPQE